MFLLPLQHWMRLKRQKGTSCERIFIYLRTPYYFISLFTYMYIELIKVLCVFFLKQYFDVPNIEMVRKKILCVTKWRNFKHIYYHCYFSNVCKWKGLWLIIDHMLWDFLVKQNIPGSLIFYDWFYILTTTVGRSPWHVCGIGDFRDFKITSLHHHGEVRLL